MKLVYELASNSEKNRLSNISKHFRAWPNPVPIGTLKETRVEVKHQFALYFQLQCAIYLVSTPIESSLHYRAITPR